MFINPNYFSFSGLLVNMIKWSKHFNILWKGIAWEQEDWGRWSRIASLRQALHIWNSNFEASEYFTHLVSFIYRLFVGTICFVIGAWFSGGNTVHRSLYYSYLNAKIILASGFLVSKRTTNVTVICLLRVMKSSPGNFMLEFGFSKMNMS